MRGYAIVNTQITDPDGYAEFIERIADVVTTYGGRYLVRGGRTEYRYGDWQPGRVVVIEFGSFEEARTFADSPEFTELREIIDRTSVGRMILAEGV